MQADSDLLAAWSDGDKEAGRILFGRHYEAVARFFRNKVGAAAPDLVQKTFLGCLESLAGFQGTGSFRSFLFAVAYRQLCKHYRANAVERDRFDLGTVTAFDLDPTPSRVLAKHREQRLLLEGLRRIPIEFQTVLELHYWEQMSASEIARALEAPLGTMKSRIRRGRALLQAQITALAGSPAELGSTLGNLEGWAAELRALALGNDEG